MFEEEIKRGAELLDRRKPGWLAKIDTAQLDLADVSRCILGQLYANEEWNVPGFNHGSFSLMISGNTRAYGFSAGLAEDYSKLTVAWREYIARRRLNELTERHTQEEREAVPV